MLGYQAWWDLPALPKLNLDAPALRALMLDVAEHWIRFGIDGWRLDVAEEVGEDFWREFRTRVRAVVAGRLPRRARSGIRCPSGSRASISTRS